MLCAFEMEGMEKPVCEVWLEAVLEVIILISSPQPHHHFEFFFLASVSICVLHRIWIKI